MSKLVMKFISNERINKKYRKIAVDFIYLPRTVFMTFQIDLILFFNGSNLLPIAV